MALLAGGPKARLHTRYPLQRPDRLRQPYRVARIQRNVKMKTQLVHQSLDRLTLDDWTLIGFHGHRQQPGCPGPSRPVQAAHRAKAVKTAIDDMSAAGHFWHPLEQLERVAVEPLPDFDEYRRYPALQREFDQLWSSR